MQKTAFHEFELFCRKSHFRAYVHNNTSLDLLRTPETDFHEFEFFAEKVILELKCTKTSLELLRTPFVFSATKQIMRM